MRDLTIFFTDLLCIAKQKFSLSRKAFFPDPDVVGMRPSEQV